MRGLGWCVVVVMVVLAGCDTQEYDQCEAPADNLKILFKPKNPVHPFSHSFCIVCNTELEEADYAAWSAEMGGNGMVGDVDEKHPCLYVYGDGEDIDTLAQCQSLVCDGGAAYSDMVGKGNGNINVGPVLDGSAQSGEEWVLVDSGAALVHAAPLDYEASELSRTHAR